MLLGGVERPRLTYSGLRAKVRHPTRKPSTNSADRPVERLAARSGREAQPSGGLPIGLTQHRDAQHELGVGAGVRLHLLAERGQLVLERHPRRQTKVRIAAWSRLGRGQGVFEQRVPAVHFGPRTPALGHQLPVGATHECRDDAAHA